jgi:putative acetyltransferase
VVTLGDPAFYGRLGFEQAAHYDLRCRWPGTERVPGSSPGG